MSRPLPRCLACGGSLARCARILAEWRGIRGVPQVGVHGGGECYRDPLFVRLQRCIDQDPRDLLREAAGRGRDRVISRMGRSEKGGTEYYWGSGLEDAIEKKGAAPSGT